MNKWGIVILVIIGGLALVGWYEFRPERLVVNHTVNEAFPKGQEDSAEALASGTFHGVKHPTNRTATVYRLGDGSRILRFTKFKTSNGPDVHVYLVAADDAKDRATVQRAGFIDLGLIKGNTVSVWCKRFSVNFGAAPLIPDHTISRIIMPIRVHPEKVRVNQLTTRILLSATGQIPTVNRFPFTGSVG